MLRLGSPLVSVLMSVHNDGEVSLEAVESIVHGHSFMKLAALEAALERVEKLGGWNEYGERCLQMYRELVDAKTQGRLQH